MIDPVEAQLWSAIKASPQSALECYALADIVAERSWPLEAGWEFCLRWMGRHNVRPGDRSMGGEVRGLRLPFGFWREGFRWETTPDKKVVAWNLHAVIPAPLFMALEGVNPHLNACRRSWETWAFAFLALSDALVRLQKVLE